MSYQDLIFACRKLVALHDVYNELYSMRIHNYDNCKAFDDEITFEIRYIKELCELELKK